MIRRRATFETLHITALSLWLGALVMTGIVAALTFPLVKSLQPTLPDFASYSGDHWKVLAGQVVNRVFAAAAFIQVIGAIVATGTLVVATVQRSVPVVPLVGRWLALAALLTCLGFNLFVLKPRMSHNARAYWDAAKAGENDRAEVFHAAFNADHGTASGTFALTAVALLLTLVAAGWSLGEKDHHADADQTPPPPPTSGASPAGSVAVSAGGTSP